MAEGEEAKPTEAQPSLDTPAQLQQSSEDLAEGLFNRNFALASVVRDLQQRSKAQRGKAGVQGDENKEETADVPGTKDPELGDGGGLWVLGGASTLADTNPTGIVKDATMLQQPKPAVAAECVAEVMDPKELAATKPVLGTPAPTPGTPRTNRLRALAVGALDTLKEVAAIIRLYPTTLIIPLVFFLLLLGLGIWGVYAGAQGYEEQRKDDARSRAVDAATGFRIQLEQSFTPGVAFSLLVRQNPDWSYWLDKFNETAEALMKRVPNGSLWNLQLQPFAQVMMMFPFRPEDISQISPPRDLLGDPTRRDGILKAIQTHQQLVNGPYALVQGFVGAFVRYPIYVHTNDSMNTFGFRYAENTSAIPYSDLPASVRNCTVCYNATTQEKWWGLLTVLVNYDQVTQGTDAYLANLRDAGYHYALVRPLDATSEQVIAQVGPTSLRGEDAVTVDVPVVDSIWQLRVAPGDGFTPSWRGPVIAAVVIIAAVMATLLFLSLVSFRRQRLLLQETMAANYNLAETTRRLEEEKERMDVLLVRQYDLLRCLDANRTQGKRRGSGGEGEGEDDSVVGSRRAMMARIEDARRSLNVAKSSVEDPIQVFEVLGAGAFGKVQRGMWRGTVVAVKTMILPANMTGQQKREKMAVMEAAISSSLVHPNIVTTYTYFIRPYHEPSHDGVQQMPLPPSSNQGSDSFTRNTGTSDDRSGSSETTIHSYEVRLVLEFCDKGSLKDALDQHAFMQGGGFNLGAMLETAVDVAKAMVHMHAANVLHSDLKARNIMLKSSGMEGRGVVAKVADFGLSTRMEHQETHLSACFQGTLTHMAPEVMLEGRISKAADVYSFGILLWELFCAGDPFSGVPRAHMGHAITKEARRPRFPPFAPRDYVTLATRCWDPDAAPRPSFEEVLADLVRMREELGGATPPLVIMPPQPLPPGHSGDGAGSAGGGEGGYGGIGVGGSVGFTAGDSPVALYNAGIVVGGGGGSSMGSGGNGGSGGGGSSKGPSRASYSSLAQRAMMKSSLAQRHLRKLGIRLGGGSSSGMGPTLAALEEESEGQHSSGTMDPPEPNKT